MSSVYIIVKQVAEKIPITLDLINYLPSAESIQPTSTVVITDSLGVNQNATILDAISISSPKITARIKAGTAGQVYTVTFTIVTENFIFEEEVRLEVKEKTG
jgi:hypothetical protein